MGGLDRQMATDTKEIAAHMRIEADYRRDYRKDDVISNVSNHLPMAFGVDGIDETDMPVYGLFDKWADIIDPQER